MADLEAARRTVEFIYHFATQSTTVVSANQIPETTMCHT